MAQGKVEMENWNHFNFHSNYSAYCKHTWSAENTDITVKAWVVLSSTPARVITIVVPNPARMEIEGDTVSVQDINIDGLNSSLISLLLISRILERKDSSQAYILISLMESMISFMLVTLLSVMLTTFSLYLLCNFATIP